MSKLSKQLISWLLLAAMLCTLLPTAVFADDAAEELVVEPTEDSVVLDDLEPQPQDADSEETVTEETVTEETVIEDQLPEDTEEPEPVSFEDELEAELVADSDVQYRIVHLDCGRKYFSKDWIIALINEMAADGYNQLQLAFGNDGLRFLLNDMSVTVNGKTYSSTDVTNAIKAGNTAYNSYVSYTSATNELTQTEMDEILVHAKDKGIEVVPMLNTPGHMYTILSAMNTLGISAYYTGTSTSKYSMNLDNTTAVAFTKALLTKYVAYFQGKDCEFFHIGTDEYANDAYSGMGFPSMGATNYSKYATYVNEIAAVVKNAGMTPRAWNDGIHYAKGTGFEKYSETFDTNLQITYWSSGWGEGYSPAPASTLAGLGHKMINTHGDYYYVIGKNLNFENIGLSYANNWSNTQFMGSTVSNPVGAMFCIWSDVPGAKDETTVAKDVRLILRAMAQAMNGQTVNVSEEIVTGGFNADGTLNAGGSSDGNDTVTVNGQEGMGKNDTQTLSLSNGETAIWTSSNESVITLASADASGVSTLATSVTAKQVTATAVGAGTSTITATTDTTSYSLDITVPADSNGGDQVGSTAGKAIELEVGGTEEITLNKALESSAQKQPADTGVATATYKTESKDATTNRTDETKQTSFSTSGTANMLIKCGDGYLTLKDGTLGYTENINEATLFTVTRTSSYGTAYYTIKANGYYVYYNNGAVATSTSSSTNRWRFDSDKGFYYQSWSFSSGTTNNYLTYNNGWTTSTSTSAYTNAYSFTTSDVPGEQKTTITVTGVAPGETTLTVDGVTYPIRVKYNEKTITLVKNSETTDTQTKTITGDVQYGEGAGDLVTVTTSGKTVTFAAKSKTGTGTVTVGNTIYTVNVIEEDLTNVQPLTVEYWITNQKVTANEATEMEVSAATVYGKNGKKLSDILPAAGEKADGAAVEFWKVTVLDEQNKQTTGADMSRSGADFTYLRYYNTKWSCSSDGKNWTELIGTEQLVAYYLQKTDVTTEITTYVADWGLEYEQWREGSTNSWFWSNYVENGSKFVFLDFAVVYEDGTQNPSTFPVDHTWFYHFDGCSASNPRYAYNFKFAENDEYEIWKVTVTDGTCSGYSNASTFKPTYDNETETIVWDESAGGTPEIKELAWTANRSGKLIRVYVRAKETENTLRVHYIDRTNGTGEEFYNYNINVLSKTFDKDIALDDSKPGYIGALKNGTVENKLGVTQTVTTDLKEMKEIGVQYRFTEYTVVGFEKSDDLTDIYIYYKFSNVVNLVVDFGLPLKITPEMLNEQYKESTVTTLDVKFDSDTVETYHNTTYGKLTNETGYVLYTPRKVISGEDMFTVYVTDGDQREVTYVVNVYPANNVLYEESFVNKVSGWEDAGQQKETEQDTPTDNDVYGQDTHYSDDTGHTNKYSNNTYLHGTVSKDNEPEANFTFTGTGVELLSECGQNTGVLYVRVTDAVKTDSGALKNKVFIVDTYFSGQFVNKNNNTVDVAMEYQVPVVQALNIPEGEHTVTVYGYYLENCGANLAKNSQVAVQVASAGATMSMGTDSGLNLDAILAEMGDEDAEVEYISMNEVLGGSDEGVAVYANQVYGDSGSTSGSVDVYIDGFRVYGPLGVGHNAYVENERSAHFESLYAYMKENGGTWNAGENSATGVVYVENIGTADTTFGGYQTNGPQNEIYLAAGSGIAFKVDGDVNVQVSAKAINGTPVLATASDTQGKTINTQTALYYVVAEAGTSTDDRIVVIYNNGNANGKSILSLTDVKLTTSDSGTDGLQLSAEPLTEDELKAMIEQIQNPQDPEEPSEPDEPSEPGDSDDDNDEEAWQNPFQDVILGKFYYEAIRWLHSHGIIKGMTESEFGLKEPADRAMVVAMLYRLEGEPEVTGTSEFSDVKKGSYYEKAVIWASENYLVGGYPDGTFRPKQKISREELIKILYSYNEFKGKDPAGSADLSQFSDSDQLHNYAKNPMRWAIDNGIVEGYNEYGKKLMKPAAETRRSEMATLLYRVYNLINGN